MISFIAYNKDMAWCHVWDAPIKEERKCNPQKINKENTLAKQIVHFVMIYNLICVSQELKNDV